MGKHSWQPRELNPGLLGEKLEHYLCVVIGHAVVVVVIVVVVGFDVVSDRSASFELVQLKSPYNFFQIKKFFFLNYFCRWRRQNRFPWSSLKRRLSVIFRVLVGQNLQTLDGVVADYASSVILCGLVLER